MTSDAFYIDGARVLTPNAFEFVLAAELKRARRAQTFLTLVALEPRRVWEGLTIVADDGTVAELAELLASEVRDTDVLACAPRGIVWLGLLDTDAEGAQTVLERVRTRIDNYRFATPVALTLGAACCPTHAVEAGALMRAALSRPVFNATRALHPVYPMERT